MYLRRRRHEATYPPPPGSGGRGLCLYANDDALHGGKRALLLTAMADEDLAAAEGADATFRSICQYLQWENAGILNAAGASTAQDLTEEDLRRAYDLGKDLK